MQTEKLILKRLSDGNFILMDNSEIKEGDWLLDTTDNTIWNCHKDMSNSLFPECKKIIRSTIRDAYGQIPSGLSLSETRELVGDKTELEVYFDEQGKLKLV